MKLIYKHSPTCRISAKAKEEIDNFLLGKPDGIHFEFVNVVENRERSIEITEKYGIKHESPQIILIDNNEKVLWYASHYQVSERNIKNEVSSIVT